MTSQSVTTVQQMIYLDGKSKNSSNEQAVAIRMNAKRRSIAIPPARDKMNALHIGGRNRPDTIKLTFQAKWLLDLPPGTHSAVFPHKIFYVFYKCQRKYY